MKRTSLIAVALMLAAAGCAPASNPLAAAAAQPAAGDCGAFAGALRACGPAVCRQAHPLVASFTIEHRIAGPEGDACRYSQSMPGDMQMSCRLSEAGRSDMAAQLDDMLSGRQTSFSFSTADPPQENTMTRECVIRDRQGAVLPWGTSTP